MSFPPRPGYFAEQAQAKLRQAGPLALHRLLAAVAWAVLEVAAAIERWTQRQPDA